MVGQISLCNYQSDMAGASRKSSTNFGCGKCRFVKKTLIEQGLDKSDVVVFIRKRMPKNGYYVPFEYNGSKLQLFTNHKILVEGIVNNLRDPKKLQEMVQAIKDKTYTYLV